jgi:hypothetical protein
MRIDVRVVKAEKMGVPVRLALVLMLPGPVCLALAQKKPAPDYSERALFIPSSGAFTQLIHATAIFPLPEGTMLDWLSGRAVPSVA